jgi:hypothetical protein
MEIDKMTNAKAKTTKKPKAKRAPKKLDLEKLKLLADEIASYGGGDFTNLIHRLETEEGMKSTSTPNGGGLYRITLAGLKASSTSSTSGALINWGNSARRLVAKGA